MVENREFFIPHMYFMPFSRLERVTSSETVSDVSFGKDEQVVKLLLICFDTEHECDGDRPDMVVCVVQ